MFERLLRTADVVIENYTPRVMEQFGLGWERLHEINPQLVMVRMPAFGLDGPWRDHTGFAQTMESVTGMAWVTGFPTARPSSCAVPATRSPGCTPSSPRCSPSRNATAVARAAWSRRRWSRPRSTPPPSR